MSGKSSNKHDEYVPENRMSLVNWGQLKIAELNTFLCKINIFIKFYRLMTY